MTGQSLETITQPKVPWLETGSPQAYGPIEELYSRVRAFYIAHLDLQEDTLFDVMAAWTFATYRQEELDFAPYLFFLGPVASGKTRALECLHQLSYRAIMATSTSSAALYRAIQAWHPTLLLDEAQVYSTEDRAEILAIINNGYRRGQYVLRVERLGKNGQFELNCFDVFGCKAVAGTEELFRSLQSRTIVFQMSKATRKVRFFLDTEEAKTLRAQLAYYRDKNQGDILFNYGEYGRLDDLEKLGNSRLGELFYPLIWVAPTDEIGDKLLNYARKVAGHLVDEEQASSEGLVFKALTDILSQAESGKLAIQRVVDQLNVDLSDTEKWNSRSVGRILSRLGFRKVRLTGGKRAVAIDTTLIDRLQKRYMASPAETSLTSLSLQIQETPIQSDISDNSDVISEVSLSPETDERQTVIDALQGRAWRLILPLQDYLTEVLGRKDRAATWIQRLREEGILVEDPEGLWRLTNPMLQFSQLSPTPQTTISQPQPVSVAGTNQGESYD